MPITVGKTSLAVVAMLLLWHGSTIASPRTACDLLSLDEVRNAVGAPVSIIDLDLSTPAVRGDTTVSTCVYGMQGASGHPQNGRSAKFSLMWAPRAKLQEGNDFYTKRHAEAPGIKGDVLVLAWVGDPASGKAGDWASSQKLLAAVLQKL